MGLINGSIPSLVQGVSQQPIQMRLPTQAEEQVNGLASLIDGLGKRPPSQFVAKIKNSGYEKPYVHFINRDENERYIVLFYPQGIEVFDEEGTAYPIVTGTAEDFTYLNTDQPNRNIKALTLSDTTFVLNRTVQTKLAPDTAPARGKEALVWVRAGTYNTEYTIKIDGTAFTHTTAVDEADTNDIADALRTGIMAAVTGLTIDRFNNVLWIRKTNGNDFTITIGDGAAGHNMSLIKAEAQRFSDLPSEAPNGYVAKIKGNVEEKADDYWVQFQTNTGVNFGHGIWFECPAPSSRTTLSIARMPHKLTRLEDTDGTVTGRVGQIYFSWDFVEWGTRLAGGPNLAIPGFLGYPISDIFLHRNRLGVVARGTVVLSQSGNLTNFWRQTALTLLDDDPIDIQVAHERAVNLRHAVNFNDELLLFSDRTQFTLKGGEVLSPRTVSITVATQYSSHIDCVPANAENMVYFPFDNGAYTGIREYYVDPSTNLKDAKTVTDHCPRYLKGSALRLTVSPTSDTMLVLTDGDRESVYVYQWYWNGNEKIQSAWHRWDFGEGCTVVALGYLGDNLYMVNVHPDGTFIERVEMAPNASDVNQDFPTLLDRRLTETSPGISMIYDPDADTTTITPPYRLDLNHEWAVVSRGIPDTGWIPARRATVVSLDTDEIVVDGDFRSGFFAGRVYPFEYTFSPAYLRSNSPLGGIAAVQEGRLQVLDWIVSYTKTGYFRAVVLPDNRGQYEYPMTGQTLLVPSPSTGLGDVQLRTGTLRFKVLSRNDQVTIKIVNDSHLPSNFSGAEWIADYSPKARRV